jgi:hypothetical protein
MLLAVGHSGDLQFVSEPQRIMALANGLAMTGLPKSDRNGEGWACRLDVEYFGRSGWHVAEYGGLRGTSTG